MKRMLTIAFIILLLTSAVLVFRKSSGSPKEMETFASDDGTHLYMVEEYGKDRHRILKIDMDSNKVLWKTGIPLKYTLNHRADYPAVFFDEKNVYYYIHESFLRTETAGKIVRTGMVSRFYLTAFDRETGNSIFSLEIPAQDNKLVNNDKVPYINMHEKIILINPILTKDHSAFTIVDKSSGTIEAQESLPCPDILARPLGTKTSHSGHFSLWSPGLAYIINTNDITDIRELRTGNAFRFQDEESFYYFNRSSGMVRHNLKEGTEEVLWDFDGSLPEDVYMYKKSLIGYKKDLITNMDSGTVTPRKQFVCYDITTGKRKWEYTLPEGYEFNIFANGQRDINPETAVYHNIIFPTLPLVISAEKEGQDKSKIIVINCENGRAAPGNTILPQTDLYPSCIFRTDSFYLLALEDKVIRILRKSDKGTAELFLGMNIQVKNIIGDRLFISRGNHVLRVDLSNGLIDTRGDGKETFYLEVTEP